MTHEKYLLKIVARVIEWSECDDVTNAEIADLVMQELVNIPLPTGDNKMPAKATDGEWDKVGVSIRCAGCDEYVCSEDCDL